MSTSAGNRQRTLVAMDMQYCFREESSQWCVPRYDEIVPVIDALREFIAGPAIFTKFVADRREHGAWGSYYQRWDQMRLPEGDPAWDLTMVAATGDRTFAKGTFSK